MGIERLDVITDNHFGMSFGAMESSSGGDYLRVEDVLARLLEIQSNQGAPGIAFFQLNQLIGELI